MSAKNCTEIANLSLNEIINEFISCINEVRTERSPVDTDDQIEKQIENFSKLETTDADYAASIGLIELKIY